MFEISYSQLIQYEILEKLVTLICFHISCIFYGSHLLLIKYLTTNFKVTTGLTILRFSTPNSSRFTGIWRLTTLAKHFA